MSGKVAGLMLNEGPVQATAIWPRSLAYETLFTFRMIWFRIIDSYLFATERECIVLPEKRRNKSYSLHNIPGNRIRSLDAVPKRMSLFL